MTSTLTGTAADVRAARAADIGLDCTNELVWGGGTWSPGGEYPKKILLRNVSPDVLVIKYKLPKSRYFHMEFPDPVKLR
jgi:cilia- and flagella-associated protein 65